MLNLVHERGRVARAEVTSTLGAARGATGDAIAELVGLGLVRVCEPVRAGTRGRPSPTLAAEPGGPVAIAAQVTPIGLDLAVVGLHAEIVARHRLALPDHIDDPARVIGALARAVTRLAEESGRACVGVGVGVAGMVRDEDGLVRSAIHLGWRDVPAGDLLAAAVPAGLPVVVRRDAALVAMAEHRHGAGRDAGTLLVVTGHHWGVGGALLGGGVSPHGTHLEVGHLVLDPRGRRCACGQRGCLETYTDGNALLRAAGLPESADSAASERLLDSARAGEPAALAAAEEVARRLGIGLTSLVNIINPDRVVCTGTFAALLALARDDVLHPSRRSVVATLDNPHTTPGAVEDPVLVGAAESVFLPLLRDPRTPLFRTDRPGGGVPAP
ncbi:ROK family protein [Actinosynnema sp. NPDC047251]